MAGHLWLRCAGLSLVRYLGRLVTIRHQHDGCIISSFRLLYGSNYSQVRVYI